MSDPRRRSARQSSGDVSESPPVSKHPADAPIDASINSPTPPAIKNVTNTTPSAPSTKGSVRFSQPESETVTGTQSTHKEGGLVDWNDDVLEEEGPNDFHGDTLVAPLIERIPTIKEIVDRLKGHYRVKQILGNVNFFAKSSQRLRFTLNYFIHDPDDDEDFWERAWSLMFCALEDNVPLTPREVKSCKDSYFYDATEMITEHFGKYIPKVYEEDTDADKNRLRNVSLSIGFVFLDLFEMLITPPHGSRIETIKKQLDSLLIEIEDMTVTNF
jgi:hypothetical protein